MIGTVVLAAGAGRRLGGAAKALLADRGATFLEAIASAARTAGAARHIVVVGDPHRARVEAEARRLGLETVVNPEPARGMSSSVEVGFGAALERMDELAAALLWPVDHPRVSAATVRLLAARAHPEGVVVPVHAGRGGHPALVGRELWPELARCSRQPEGARSVLRARPERVLRLEVDDPGAIADVDTPSDLG